MYDELIAFVREWYDSAETIPLSTPRFGTTEREYDAQAIDSTIVSSIGHFVDEFEQLVAEYTGSQTAVATVNGTAALHVALRLVGVESDDEVVTQPLSFVATANAISYQHAHPVFVDVDRKTLGLSPVALDKFFHTACERRGSKTINRHTGRRIAAVVPMHTFGLPCDIQTICDVAEAWGVPVVEDAAEALGSTRGGRHCGTFGRIGIYSFNGNKTITTGGGGMIVTDRQLADRARHLTTTAKLSHQWEYTHDDVGYNFRMPNLNAALGCAQMSRLESLVADKRALSQAYARLFDGCSWAEFVDESADCRSNAWLHAILMADADRRDAFLEQTHAAGILTRPVWTLLSELPMYRHCETDGLADAQWLSKRLVTLPSSARETRG